MKFSVNTLILSFSLFTGTVALAAAAPGVDPLANPPKPQFEGQTGAPAPASMSRVKMQVIASGLTLPRSLVTLPDGNLIVTEGSGTIRVLGPDGTLSDPVKGMPAIRSVNGRSMNDFILDHNFARNRKVYFTYMAPPAGQSGGPASAADQARAQQQGKVFQVPQVASATLSKDNSRVENVKVIAEIPGRRMVSAPDGTLYISTVGFGDDRGEVQKLTSLLGKFLRINADGSIPRDNPYYGRSMLRQEIFSWGHRDPDGMAINPQTGELWAVEHGPMGGDELNVIRAGKNYGWPYATYGKNYDGTEIGPTNRSVTEQPLYYWFPSVAPSGMLFYTGNMFPGWKNNILVGSLSPTQGKFLIRLVMDGEKVMSEEHLLVDHDRRIRSIAQGNDGAVYLLTDSEDNDQLNRHFPGEVLKLTPG